MGRRVDWTSLLLLILALTFSLDVTAQHRDDTSRRVTAPKRNAGGGVIDGSGLEHIISSDEGVNGMGEWQFGNNRVSVSTVALLTLAMAAATGLGAVPFFFLELDPQWAGLCNGMAAGVMLAASFDLIQEGQGHGGGSCVVLGILAGGAFIWLCKKFLEQYGEMSMLDIKGADAAKAVLVVGIMTLHSFGEGSGVGVSFAGSKGLSQGILVTLAIAIHNIPEGLAVSMVLASRGVSPQKAMLWSVVSSLPQPIVAVPSFIFADAFNKFLPLATGFAAGCMIWMVMAEIIPDAFKESAPSHVASCATLSVAFMESLGAIFQHFSHSYSPEDSSGFLVSLLFGMGPLLGGGALVAFALSLRLRHALLTGVASGIAFVLGVWRPLQLLLSSKFRLLPLLSLLALGSASLHLPSSLIRKLGDRKKTSSAGAPAAASSVLPAASAPTLQAALSCAAIALHALAEGLALGVAAPRAYGLGRHMLLPVSLHGLPRGVAAAGCIHGATDSWHGSLLSAAIVGLAGPLSAIGAMLAGIDRYDWPDVAMVAACGGIFPCFAGIARRAARVDGRGMGIGLVIGLSLAVGCQMFTRLLCLHTPYCNSAPEAVR